MADEDGWEEVKFDDEPEEKLQVTFTHCEDHDGKRFHAGGVFIHLGGGPGMAAVAMMVGDEKYVLPDDHAPEWLTARGLPAEKAASLVAEAVAERDAD